MCMLEEWLVKSLMIIESVRIIVWGCIHSTRVGFLKGGLMGMLICLEL